MKYYACSLAVTLALCASKADSQTFTTLLQFSGTTGVLSGDFAYGGLTVSGTTLYGMTITGGGAGHGSVYSVSTNGTHYQNLLSFTGGGGAASGQWPNGSVTLSGTTLYGMTQFGGANANGNIFSVGVDGSNYRNLVSFTDSSGSANGNDPLGSLILNGTTLYGMVNEGGTIGYGTVFSVGADGANYKNLVSFSGSGGATIGDNPYDSLTLGGNTLFGVTQLGGADTVGNLFSVSTDGTNFRNLISFTGSGGSASGAYPYCTLTLSGTTLYGMTEEGGANSFGNIFSVGTDGTTYRNLLSFTGTSGAASGSSPIGNLTLTGTTLYGVTGNGGVNGDGNIFSVGIDGSNYQDLYNFTGGTDGGYPGRGLTFSDGTLFGVTRVGANGYGTVFAVALPTPEPGTLALAGSAAAVAAALLTQGGIDIFLSSIFLSQKKSRRWARRVGRERERKMDEGNMPGEGQMTGICLAKI